MPVLTRRAALLGLGAAFTMGRISLALADAATEKRFVVVLLRGALDGLSAVTPYGESALAGLRGNLLLPSPGQANGLLDLGGFYGLHPSLAGLHTLYQAGELLPVHAVAGPYRVRSHFEAQDCMESGADHRMDSGWLNRVVATLPPPATHQPDGEAVAIGVTVPLLLRGKTPIGAWAPHGAVHTPPDLYSQIAALNQSDPVIGPAIAEGLQGRGFSDAAVAGDMSSSANRYAFPALARAAGELLGAPNGPRIAALEIGGWDTHVAQDRRLSVVLKQLDAGLVALRTALGSAWKQTVVLTMTEFGRTVRINGTQGTDHGTASVAFVLGGTVAGGRVLADWPGLGPGKLFENRDLAPTTDLRSIAKGLLAAHFGLSGTALATIFPDSAHAAARSGLLRV